MGMHAHRGSVAETIAKISTQEDKCMALTKEQIASKTEDLKAYIAAHKDIDGPLMPIMQYAQESFSYLSMETMTLIADSLNVPVTDVYGIATFYAQFALSPKGENHIAVCLGTACYVKGSGDIYNKLQEVLGIAGDECTADRKFSLAASRCIGACGLAPVLTVNEDVYGRLTVDDVAGIVEKYKA